MRREEPRIAAKIRAALGDARTVMNVGAGSGAYEPPDLDPVVRAFAEELPFDDGSFWDDHARGCAELRRMARRVVLFTWEPASARETWIVRDYFPCFEELIPQGDGFFHAYWRRPEAYLDPQEPATSRAASGCGATATSCRSTSSTPATGS